MQDSIEKWRHRRMTIIVGMVGVDGIVLAADQRATRNAQREDEFDDHMGIRKITHLEQHGVVFAGVGDDVTREAGKRLADGINTGVFRFANIERSLENIVVEIVAITHPCRFENKENRSLTIGFHGNKVSKAQLWYAQIGPPPHCVYRIVGAAVSGAIGNRARFFDSYFRANLSVERLIFLASHIVLNANRFDPAMIEGLDVAIFGRNGLRLLDETQKDALRVRSREFDNLIRREILGGSA